MNENESIEFKENYTEKIYEMLKIGTLPTDVAQWLNDKEVIYQNHGDIIFFD